jgi:hypothetical protein
MEEKNQQDRFLGVDRELGDDPEGRVKVEGASQEYEFSSEESEGEENNREVEHDPLFSILIFTFDSSLRTTRIQRVVLDFPIVFLPFRLFTGELIGRNSNGAQAVQWGNV